MTDRLRSRSPADADARRRRSARRRRERWHTRINRAAGYLRAGRPRLAGAADRASPPATARAAGQASSGGSSACRCSRSCCSSAPGRGSRPRCRPASAPAGTGCRSGSRPAISGPTIVAERAKAARLLRAAGEAQRRDPGRRIRRPRLEVRPYTGKPTFIDQIFTSLKTVFTGFVFATLVAVPLGILCGLFVDASTPRSIRWCRSSSRSRRSPGCRSSPWWSARSTSPTIRCSRNRS